MSQNESIAENERVPLSKSVMELQAEALDARTDVKLVELRSEMREGFSRVNTRGDTLEGRMVSLEDRMLSLEERQTKLEERQTQLEERMLRLEERQTHLEERMVKPEERQIKLEEQMVKLTKTIEQMRIEMREQEMRQLRWLIGFGIAIIGVSIAT